MVKTYPTIETEQCLRTCEHIMLIGKPTDVYKVICPEDDYRQIAFKLKSRLKNKKFRLKMSMDTFL